MLIRRASAGPSCVRALSRQFTSTSTSVLTSSNIVTTTSSHSLFQRYSSLILSISKNRQLTTHASTHRLRPPSYAHTASSPLPSSFSEFPPFSKREYWKAQQKQTVHLQSLFDKSRLPLSDYDSSFKVLTLQAGCFMSTALESHPLMAPNTNSFAMMYLIGAEKRSFLTTLMTKAILFAALIPVKDRINITVNDLYDGVPEFCRSILTALNFTHLPETREYLKSVCSYPVYKRLIQWNNATALLNPTQRTSHHIPDHTREKEKEGQQCDLFPSSFFARHFHPDGMTEISTSTEPVEHVFQCEPAGLILPINFKCLLYHYHLTDVVDDDDDEQARLKSLAAYYAEMNEQVSKIIQADADHRLESSDADLVHLKKGGPSLNLQLEQVMRSRLIKVRNNIYQRNRPFTADYSHDPEAYPDPNPHGYTSYVEMQLPFALSYNLRVWSKQSLLEWNETRITDPKRAVENPPIPLMYKHGVSLPCYWTIRIYLPPPNSKREDFQFIITGI